MSQHAEFHYSISLQTHDPAVLHCLRAISQFAQKSGNKRIPWGGTKESDWKACDYCVTFHFTSCNYRTAFRSEVARLLPGDLWKVVGEADADPATPQNAAW